MNIVVFSYSGSRMYLLTRSNSFTWSKPNSMLYLHTDQYPKKFLSGYAQSICNVSAGASSNISVYTLDIRLGEGITNSCVQSLMVEDMYSAKEWDCSYTDGFNITKLTFANQITITFTSNSSENMGHVWIGIDGKHGEYMKLLEILSGYTGMCF